MAGVVWEGLLHVSHVEREENMGVQTSTRSLLLHNFNQPTKRRRGKYHVPPVCTAQAKNIRMTFG
jgi:hypothetical protein